MVGLMVPSEESKMRVCSWVMSSFEFSVWGLLSVRLMVSFFRIDGSGFQSGVLFRSLAMEEAAAWRSFSVESLAESMMRS